MMLVLVGSSLIARRLPIGQTVRMALGWLAIFAVIFVGYSFRDELSGVFRRVSGELWAGQSQTTGGALRVPMSEDGHFWVSAEINGITTRFMVDSGATTTGLSTASAEATGLQVDSGFPVMLETANGTARAQRARIDRMRVGPIRSEGLAVLVSPGLGDTNLLGMNFLSSLKSWRVENRALILEPYDKSP